MSSVTTKLQGAARMRCRKFVAALSVYLMSAFGILQPFTSQSIRTIHVRLDQVDYL